MIVELRVRRGTTTEWETIDPVLADGEMGFDETLRRMKMGDGVSTWSALPYYSFDPAEVQATVDAATVAASDAQDAAAGATEAAAAFQYGFAIPLAAGRHYLALPSTSDAGSTNQAMTADRMYMSRFLAGRATDLTALAVEVTTAAAGSAIRGGLYSRDPDTGLLTLLADFGTVDSTSTGVKSWAINHTVGALEEVVLALVAQGGAPSIRMSTTHDPHWGQANASSALSTNTAGAYQSAVSGALPASANVDGVVASIPRAAISAAA